MVIFEWINNQLLKMNWLFELVESLVVKVFGLSMDTRLGASIHFFIYDVIKIFILLSALIFVISYVQSFFPPERTKRILGNFNGITANILAALLGLSLPSVPALLSHFSLGLPVQGCPSAQPFPS